MQSDPSDQILFQITCAANAADDLDHLCEEIHLSLKKWIDATNFSIVLFDADEEVLTVLYSADEVSQVKAGDYTSLKDGDSSMFARVIQKKVPMILNREEIYRSPGPQTEDRSTSTIQSWLGAPLMIGRNVIGALALQSYSDEHCYKPEDLRLLVPISEQIALVIEQKHHQIRYQNLIEGLNDVVYKTDNSGRIVFVSPSINGLTGFTKESLIGVHLWKEHGLSGAEYSQFLHPDDREHYRSSFDEAFKKQQPFEVEYRLVGYDRSETWVRERGLFIEEGPGLHHLEGWITQIQERKKTEQINKILFAISNAANTTDSLNQLYQTIHQSLLTIADIDHFNIGMYDRTTDTITFVYDTKYVDIEHPPFVLNASRTTSLTAEVIRQNKPLIFSGEEMIKFAASKGGKVIGTVSESWLGVPLKVKGEVIGAMLAETLTPNRSYSKLDADWFSSVSEQIGIAIERKRAEAKIKAREKTITSLYQISNAMHTTDNLNDLYQAIFSALANIIEVTGLSIALYHHETDSLEIQYPADSGNPKTSEIVYKASQSGLLAFRVVREGKPVITPIEKQARAGSTDKPNTSNVRVPKGWLGIPLIGKKRVLGAIICQTFSDRTYHHQPDIPLFESISEQIAIAIEYKNAETDLVSTRNELIERAHKAGMADIASDTIHNLGNILNSIKTSNSIINGVLENSQLENFNRALEMLEEHIDQLELFVCQNPNGEKLLKYLIAIEQALSTEVSTIHEQTERLSSKIGLMQEVIESQQNYVNDFYVEEECQLDLVVDQILEMHRELFENLGIEITRQYSDTDKIRLQKTKLEHVLMNIINNAREAMERQESANKVFSVSLRQESRAIYLRFKDSGEGIPPKYLKRIFSHGFTTKEHGNGFGLRNASRFLADMGGEIWAESDGKGKGATFVLQFNRDWKGQPESVEET